MPIFGTLGVSGSGLHLHRKWLDAVADNLANVNTVRPTSGEAFRQRMVVAQAENYGQAGGVRVAGAAFGNPEGRLAHEPDHPLADAEGYVRRPDIDMADQMTELMMAQRGYQANLAVVDRARDAYLQALTLGK